MQARLLQRPEHRGDGQDRQQPCLRASLPADPADDDAAHGQGDDEAGPGPGIGEHGERAVGAGDPLQCCLLDPGDVAAPADQHSGDQERNHHDQQGRGPPGREPAGFGEHGEHREREHDQVEQGRRIRRGVGQRQRGAGRDHPAGGLSLFPGADHAPGGQRDEEHRHGVVGGERSQVQRRAQDGEQRGGEERGPAPEQPPGGAPQQRCCPEHEHQGQDPGAGQAPDAVR